MRHAYLLLFPLSLVLPQTVLAQQGTLVGEKVDRTARDDLLGRAQRCPQSSGTLR